MDKEQRAQVVAQSVAQLEKAFGKGILQYLGRGPVEPIAVIPTGSLNLDIILGVGGWPRGRIVEVFGGEATGKTSLCLHAIAQAQRAGTLCAYIDAEHALDPKYAQAIGVNMHELLISQPDYGEQALEIADTLVRTSAIGVLVIDSVAALVPKAELDGEMGASHMALQARLMSQAMRKLTATVSRTGTLIMFINQVRQRLGIVFGNPETTTGGNALKFYSSVRAEIRRAGTLKEGDRVVGNRTRVKIVKNKVAPPFREAEFDLLYGVGIARPNEVLEAAEALGFVEKAGAWYTLGGERTQGKANVLAALAENPALLDSLDARVRAHYGLAPRPAAEGATSC